MSDVLQLSAMSPMPAMPTLKMEPGGGGMTLASPGGGMSLASPGGGMTLASPGGGGMTLASLGHHSVIHQPMGINSSHHHQMVRIGPCSSSALLSERKVYRFLLLLEVQQCHL